MDEISQRMNVPEFNDILKDVVDLAKYKAKLANTFIVYQVGQTIIREYPNGVKVELIFDPNGDQNELPLHA